MSDEARDVEATEMPDRATHIFTWLCRYEGGLVLLLGSYMTVEQAQQHRPTKRDGDTTKYTLIRVRLP